MLVTWSTTLLHFRLVDPVIHAWEELRKDCTLGSYMYAWFIHVLSTHLAIQRCHVHCIMVQFATEPQESLVIMFILLLALLKRNVHHLPLLASSNATRFAAGTLTFGHFDRPSNYWMAITCILYIRTSVWWPTVIIDPAEWYGMHCILQPLLWVTCLLCIIDKQYMLIIYSTKLHIQCQFSLDQYYSLLFCGRLGRWHSSSLPLILAWQEGSSDTVVVIVVNT